MMKKMKRLFVLISLILIIVTSIFCKQHINNLNKQQLTIHKLVEKTEETVMETTTRIKISFDHYEIVAIIYDNQTSIAFLNSLPLETTFTDFVNKEKIATLANPLAVADDNLGIAAKQGDIMYYAPWQNLVVFYQDNSYANGLVAMGSVESGLEFVTMLDQVTKVYIEKI